MAAPEEARAEGRRGIDIEEYTYSIEDGVVKTLLIFVYSLYYFFQEPTLEDLPHGQAGIRIWVQHSDQELDIFTLRVCSFHYMVEILSNAPPLYRLLYHVDCTTNRTMSQLTGSNFKQSTI